MKDDGNDPRACFLVICEDRPGIVAAVSGLLFSHRGNITALDQHSTGSPGKFFMRLEFDTTGLDVPLEQLEAEFGATIAGRFGMDWRLRRFAHRPRLAVLVSKHEHALLDLLWNARRGDLAGDIALVISNHPDLREAVAWFGIPFEHVPVEGGAMDAAERRMLELLDAAKVDLVVLARYMRILSGPFTRRYPHRIINIHHSFLPAFKGADPYGQAADRGVKLIGATAHYVVEELDAGPIIEQAVRPVSHRQTVQELRALGREIESQVLTRAVKLHVEERILVDGHKTVVF